LLKGRQARARRWNTLCCLKMYHNSILFLLYPDLCACVFVRGQYKRKLFGSARLVFKKIFPQV